MKALSIVIFIISVLIIGCGEERSLPTIEDQQALMAPKNPKDGNSYGQNRILALNTSSGEIVCVPEIAVEKSPVLIKLPELENGEDFSDVDVVIIIKGTAGKIEKKETMFLYYVWLKPEASYEQFIEELMQMTDGILYDVEVDAIEKDYGLYVKITCKDDPDLSQKMDMILGMMTNVDAFKNPQ